MLHSKQQHSPTLAMEKARETARATRITARFMATREAKASIPVAAIGITAQASITQAFWGLLAGIRITGVPAPALPPGIQKNLARGKPLPPGIAKKLDGRLVGRLPHYDGYEWQQAGTDLILVALATGLIYEVLNGAFD